MKIGAFVGGLVFVMSGIIPAISSGSGGASVLLQKLVDGTIEPTLFLRASVLMGIVVGIARGCGGRRSRRAYEQSDGQHLTASTCDSRRTPGARAFFCSHGCKK
jgi:hypothetical protein